MPAPLCEQVHGNGGVHNHHVQLYEADERVLSRNVAQFLWEGAAQGEGLLVIATAEHGKAFTRQLRELGADPKAAAEEGWLLLLDPEETLSHFMVEGQPDWKLFQATILPALRKVRRHNGTAGARAYGEMVGVLWQAGQYDAAIRLEEFWNDLLKSGGFQLFCGYPIDVFGKDFHAGAVDALLCAHTHLVPASHNGDIETALDRAMHDVFGHESHAAGYAEEPSRRPAWAVMPKAEAAILALREKAPGQADDVLTRARHHYESEKRFRALVENSSDAITLLDARGKVLYASASTARVLGYRPQEVVGQRAIELVHPEDREAVALALKEALAEPRRPIRAQARVRRKDGNWCWVESTSANLLDEPNVGAIVSNYRDISERKAAEQEKLRYTEELARSHAELQAFAYAATHDLQEPLRTVCAFTQLLIQRTPVDENGKEFAGFIVDGVKRMSVLLDDLLSFTRLSVNEQEERVELKQAVEQASHTLAAAIRESGATIAVDPLPAVHGNASHLAQLFQNLLGNAIKYRSERPVRIHVGAEQAGREWVVKVKDNGIGIAPEYRDQIFGLFKRLHSRDIPGTGIGLAVCKKIVEGMGGRIWVEAELGRGSTFCFTIGPEALPELQRVPEALSA